MQWHSCIRRGLSPSSCRFLQAGRPTSLPAFSASTCRARSASSSSSRTSSARVAPPARRVRCAQAPMDTPLNWAIWARTRLPWRSIPASPTTRKSIRSEEHTSELQSQSNLVCRLLLEKKKLYYTASSVVTSHLVPHRKCARIGLVSTLYLRSISLVQVVLHVYVNYVVICVLV